MTCVSRGTDHDTSKSRATDNVTCKLRPADRATCKSRATYHVLCKSRATNHVTCKSRDHVTRVVQQQLLCSARYSNSICCNVNKLEALQLARRTSRSKWVMKAGQSKQFDYDARRFVCIFVFLYVWLVDCLLLLLLYICLSTGLCQYFLYSSCNLTENRSNYDITVIQVIKKYCE